MLIERRNLENYSGYDFQILSVNPLELQGLIQ